MDIALVLVGLLLGALGAWFAVRARPPAVAEPSDRLLDAFRAVSAEALAAQGQQLGEQLVQLADAKYGALHQRTDTVLSGHSRAVDDGLRSLADRLAQLEAERTRATTEISTMVRELNSANEATRREAANLASALRDNRARGVWGEVQLRRVLELAGMERHVGFVEQRGVGTGTDRGRPDVVVPLAGGHCVVIDAKVPLDRYLEAVNTADPVQEALLLREHAKAVASHVTALAGRDYVAKVDGAVDMVLLFLPADPFLAAALDAEPGLLESSAAKGVHLVTPSSLIPVLKGIALGWREHRATEAAAEIHRLGTELHERIGVFAHHYAAVGHQLDRTVKTFNESVGSLDTRVLVTARRLAELGAESAKPLAEPVQVDRLARTLRAVDAAPTWGDDDGGDPHADDGPHAGGQLDLRAVSGPALAPIAPVADAGHG